MKRAKFVVVLVLAINCFVQLTTAAKSEQLRQESALEPKGRGPQIHFEKTTHDFGELAVGEKGACEFPFRNTGTETLKIEKTKASCGCTAVKLDKKDYDRGEKGFIKIQYSGQSQPGTAKKTIDVYTNDPDNKMVRLLIQAQIVQFIEAEPSNFSIKIHNGDANVPDILLKSKDGRPFSVKDFVSTGSNAIRADFDPNFSAENITLHPNVDINQINKYRQGSIRISISHPQCKAITIPYQVAPKYSTNPINIVIHDAEPNEKYVKEVTITDMEGGKFEIESVSSDEGYIQLLEQEQKDNTRQIKLSITAPVEGLKRMHFRDILHIKIKDGETISVSCLGLYRRSHR